MFHAGVLNTNHGSHWIAIGGDRGAAQHARASTGLHPGGSGAGFTGHDSDCNVAAEADDVVKMQLFCERLVEFLIAEAAVGDDANLGIWRQQLGKSHQRAMFVKVAVSTAETNCAR